MLPVSLYSTIVLLIILGAQIWRPFYAVRSRGAFFQIARYAFFISAVFIFGVASYSTYQQYQIWQASPLSQLLLPPNQPLGYFIQYAITHFWTSAAIAFAFALLALSAGKILNKKFGYRFFEAEEPWLFATGLFLSGHPGWIFYSITVFALALIFASLRFLLTREKGIILSFYWVWIPTAILTGIIRIWFKFPFSS